MADHAAFLDILRHLLGNDNALRKTAEQHYGEAKKAQPAATVVALFQVVEAAPVEQPVREQAAVLLRQCLEKARDCDSVYVGLGEVAQREVRAKLLLLLLAEPDVPPGLPPKLRRMIGDCVQALGNCIIDVQGDARPQEARGWPELIPSLMTAIVDGTRDGALRADCLWVLKELCTSIWKILVGLSQQTFQLLSNCLQAPLPGVKADATCLFCSLADNIESREERKLLAPLIVDVCTTVTVLETHSDAVHLKTVLQTLVGTTEMADFLRGHMASHVMPLLHRIAMSHGDEASRKYALEVMLSFAESKPKAMLKVAGYAPQTLEVCLHFMMQLNSDVNAWMEDNDEDGEDDEEHFTFGKEAVDRVCRCASKVECFASLLEVLKPAITKLFQTGGWKETVAAISTMSQAAEFIDDEATIEQMVHVIKVQLSASNARVRYAAWGALAQFAEDHSEVISTDAWVAQLMPEFLKGLDESCQRVCLRSMLAFQHYGESVEREDLEPFVKPLMEKLGVKMQSGDHFQKKAITFIAVIAGQVEEAFAPYYGALMPVLKQVIQAAIHKVEERTLLGKCFECISLLAKAVGREGFRADAEHIMHAMIQATQMPNLPSDDPVKEYMMAASERICSTLKQDFLPFVPHILPGVLDKLTLAPKEFGQDTDDLEEGTEVNLTMVQEDGKVKVLVMYSSDMQDLKGALEAVHTFVEELGRAYAPFVADTAKALLPTFDFSMGEEIRDLAFETWGQLCNCARENGQVQTVSELLMEFLKRILPTFEAAAVDPLALKTRADGITTCLKKAGKGILAAEQVRHLCQVSLTLLGESLQRREEDAKKQKAQQEEDEDDDDDGTSEQALRTALCEIAGAVMQHHPDLFAAEGLPTYLALAQRLMQSEVIGDRKLACFVTCDFLEHLGPRVAPQWPQFLPRLMEDVLHEDAELRQPACYGLSWAAKEQAFAPLAAEAAQKLAQVVTQSRRREKKRSEKLTQACADNALSALVEVLLTHSATLDAAAPGASAQLWGVWVSGLPCQEDEQEGEKNHKVLLKLLQDADSRIAGQDVPRLLAMLTDLYKTDMVDEETSRGIGQLMLRAGTARLDEYAAQYTAKQRKRLQRIVEEAQKEAVVN